MVVLFGYIGTSCLTHFGSDRVLHNLKKKKKQTLGLLVLASLILAETFQMLYLLPCLLLSFSNHFSKMYGFLRVRFIDPVDEVTSV